MSDSFKRADDPMFTDPRFGKTAQQLHAERLAAGETIQEATSDRHLHAATGVLAFLALVFIAALVWAVLVAT